MPVHLKWFDADEEERQRLTALSNRDIVFTVVNAQGYAQEMRRPLTVSNNPDRRRIAVYIVFDCISPDAPNGSTIFLHLGKDTSRTIIESDDRTHLILPESIPLTGENAL